MRALNEVLVGLLFGIGLLISGMTDPAKVQGFLDITGNWDPSLAFVMMGAIGVAVFAFAYAKKRTTCAFGGELNLPKPGKIDKRLIIGSLVFGAGWGLAGICPGPSLVVMATGELKAVVFVAAMLLGMWLFEVSNKSKK